MTDIKKYAIEVTRDIVIARLSSTSSTTTGSYTGKSISEMFEEIYTKIYAICSTDEPK